MCAHTALLVIDGNNNKRWNAALALFAAMGQISRPPDRRRNFLFFLAKSKVVLYISPLFLYFFMMKAGGNWLEQVFFLIIFSHSLKRRNVFLPYSSPF